MKTCAPSPSKKSSRKMQQELINEIAKFILYLENVDGESWNSLMKELSATYGARQGLMYATTKARVTPLP
jgi:hypothetical protein